MDRAPDHPAETLRKIEAQVADIYAMLSKTARSAPPINWFEGGRRLMQTMMGFWAVVVLAVALFIKSETSSPLDSDFVGITAGWWLGGQLVIWLVARLIGWVVRGFVGSRQP